MTDWVRANVFNIITTITLVVGSFVATNERIVRLEERLSSLNDRYFTLEKKIDDLRADLKDSSRKQDQILQYMLEK